MFKRLYLDGAATSMPIARCIIDLTPCFGNASSIYKEGRDAKKIIEKARERIANKLSCHEDEIVFTSGGTESDNLAIRGVIHQHIKDYPDGFKPHIIASAIEHKAVLNTLKDLKELNMIDYDLAPVDNNGFVIYDEYCKLFNSRTVLVSIMMANNEVGTIQDIQKLSKYARKRGTLFHTDAVQSFCKLEIDLSELKNVDFLSISGHKISGIKGAGALFIRDYARPAISPIITGGSQESNMRAGTENVMAIEALGLSTMVEMDDGLEQKRDQIIKGIIDAIPTAYLNGPMTARLPDNINIGFEGINGEDIVMRLDAKGIAISAGSACNAGELSGSHVLMAMGKTKQESLNCVRITVPNWITHNDISRLINTLKEVIITHEDA